MAKYHLHHRGFTIVELLIVVVVIAILATIGIVSYNGMQRRGVEATLHSDLQQGRDELELLRLDTGEYPATLPDTIKPSPEVNMQLVTNTLPHYSGLTPVQNGVLYQTVCSGLIGEGYGRGTNNGGATEQYVTACNVYGYGAMQINGWNANSFNVSIGNTTVRSWYNANISYDSYRPNHKADVLAFADELTTRFQAMGGTFPVTSFWDPWANPGNGGVMKQELPEPDGAGGGETYCLQATSTRFNDVVWHVASSGVITDGSC